MEVEHCCRGKVSISTAGRMIWQAIRKLFYVASDLLRIRNKEPVTTL